jgi:hypothetical protein
MPLPDESRRGAAGPPRFPARDVDAIGDGVTIRMSGAVRPWPFAPYTTPGDGMGSVAQNEDPSVSTDSLFDGCTNRRSIATFMGAVKLDATIKGFGAGVLMGAVGGIALMLWARSKGYGK